MIIEIDAYILLLSHAFYGRFNLPSFCQIASTWPAKESGPTVFPMMEPSGIAAGSRDLACANCSGVALETFARTALLRLALLRLTAPRLALLRLAPRISIFADFQLD